VEPLSPRARALLQAHREVTAASDELRERVRERLERSTAPPTRSSWMLPIAAVTAIAAIVLLWVARPQRMTVAEHGERDHAAPFVHERDAETNETRSPSVSRAVSDGSPETEPIVSDAEPQPSPSSAERKATTPRARRPAPPERSEVEPAGPDLAAEMAVLRRAGTLVRAGDGRGALAVLDEHAQRFPAGQLLEDREALRVQALCATGDVAAAQTAARAFESAHPKSVHLRRVRSSVAECSPR
jgi:cytoskeletal protein RodZ